MNAKKSAADIYSNELLFLFFSEKGEQRIWYYPFSFYGSGAKHFAHVAEKIRQAFEDKSWDDVFVVNFKKIRETVDLALEPKTEFSTFDIIKALGIPRERLKDWMSKGYAKPSIPAKGKGTKAVFYRIDVYTIALFRHLVEDRHFTRDVASWVANHWRDNLSPFLNKNQG